MADPNGIGDKLAAPLAILSAGDRGAVTSVSVPAVEGLAAASTRTFSPDKDAHIPVLDGVRGMAVLMVLLFHFWQGLPVYGQHFSPGFNRALTLFSLGQKGVDLFFVLSGFLITGILLRTKGSPHYFKYFYIRRTLRIFPLYFAVVFACLLVGEVWSLPKYQWHNLWWYLCYLQNVAMTFWPAEIDGLEHFWSLAVEEHFYLFWPLLVFLLNRRQLAVFSVSLIILSVIIRAWFLFMDVDVFHFTLCRMDTLALGALLAIVFSDPARWRTVQQWTRRLFIPVAGLAFGSFFILSGAGNPAVQTLKYTLFAVLCGAVLVLALSPGFWNPAPRLFQHTGLRSMGKTSYAMYVFHPFVYSLLMGRFYYSAWSPLHGRFWPSAALELALCLGATIFVAGLSWVLFEHPLIKLKKLFEYEERSRLQPAA